MKVRYAEFRAREGCETRVAQLLSDLTECVRDEPGNVHFEPYTRVEQPREYVVFELYLDDDAFRDHLGSPHSRAFNEQLHEVIEGTGSTLAWLSPAGLGSDVHG